MWKCDNGEMGKCENVRMWEFVDKLFFLTKPEILNYLNFLMVKKLKKIGC